MKSLQSRLNIGLGLSLIIVLTLTGLLASSVIDGLTESLIVSRLEHDGDSIITALRFDREGGAQLATEQLNAIYQRAYSGHYYSIELAGQTSLRSRSLWDQTLNSRPLAMGEQGVWEDQGPAAQPLLVWSGRFNKQGRDFTLLVAEDLSPLQQSLNRFGRWFAALAFCFLILLMVIQGYLIRRGFKPIRQLSQEIQYLEQGDIQTLSTQVPSEVQPLVSEVNHLIRQLRQQLERSRASTGNLAHALKTPLTLLQQIGDKPQLQQHPALVDEIQQQTRQIRKLIDRELTRARLAGSAAPGQRFSPSRELPELREILQRIYHDKALKLNFDYPDNGPLPIERDDMLELLGNLLDNACKWAHHTVRLSLQMDTLLQIMVEDDGPGCDDEQLALLTQAGRRMDESKSGHGLGLSIVNDIVAGYQGSLVLGRSQSLGGLCVNITLPTSPARAGEAPSS